MNKAHKNAKDLDLETGIKTLHTGHKSKLQQKHGQTNFRHNAHSAFQVKEEQVLGTASFQSRETTILYLLLRNHFFLVDLFVCSAKVQQN